MKLLPFSAYFIYPRFAFVLDLNGEGLFNFNRNGDGGEKAQRRVGEGDEGQVGPFKSNRECDHGSLW